MWYMPYRRVRSAVLVYVCLALGVSFVAVALRFWSGAVHLASDGADVHVDLALLVAGAAALVGGFATVLGLNLAAENDGHLELAWTKPITREGYALGVFAVDIAAMAACVVFTAVCAVAVVDIFHGGQVVTPGSAGGLLRMLGFCGFPLCVYAWITALSASLKRNRATVAGLFWPLMIVLGALQLLPVPAVHAVVAAIDLFNPLVIFTTSVAAGMQSAIGHDAWGWAVAALLLTVALFQWRRLQL